MIPPACYSLHGNRNTEKGRKLKMTKDLQEKKTLRRDRHRMINYIVCSDNEALNRSSKIRKAWTLSAGQTLPVGKSVL